MTQLPMLTDEALLDRLQEAAFGYFLQTVNPLNGLVADTSRENSPVSIAVVGFALSSYPVAVERGWMGRGAAIQATLAALRFFRDSQQGNGDDHKRDCRKGQRVGWTDVVDEAAHDTRQCQCNQDSQHCSHYGQPRSLGQHQLQQTLWRRAQGQAQTELGDALADGIRDYAVRSDRGQNDSQSCE